MEGIIFSGPVCLFVACLHGVDFRIAGNAKWKEALNNKRAFLDIRIIQFI